jgi:hypothetical protein
MLAGWLRVRDDRLRSGGSVENDVNDCCLARVAAVALALPFLQACVAGMAAVQAIPAAVGVIAVANAEDRSPFRSQKPNLHPPAVDELAQLDAQIRRAECGDAEAQYLLASTLKDNAYTTPNAVEIYKWYRLAQMGEFAPATDELTALDATMSEPDIAKARMRAREWQPMTEGCPVGG